MYEQRHVADSPLWRLEKFREKKASKPGLASSFESLGCRLTQTARVGLTESNSTRAIGETIFSAAGSRGKGNGYLADG
ncbi:hypothetical protein K0M31_012907, partial [Melipona bicolor]